MILSNLRVHAAFLTILLMLCCFIPQSAIANPGQLPESLHDVLQGTESDLISVASELKDTDLPAAIAIVELLKFKALHQETAVTSEQINKFELLIKNRLKSSSVVSFTETETCRSKIYRHEIEIDGQKITVPEYYVANVGLIITDVIPAGEAGTVFPDIQINFVSQSPIAEYILNIDGNTVPNGKISVFIDDNEQGLIFRPDLNADGILSIGTHTAEISISNEKGELAKKHWTFTVGIHDTSEPPVPDDATIVTEFPISPERILPGGKATGELYVIVYQDKSGTRYTSYRLVSSSGMAIQSSNLAFIARALDPEKRGTTYVHILPRLTFAFVGNQITFSYEYEFSTPGTIVKETWSINSGGQVYSEPTVTISGYTTVRCELLVEHSYRDNDGQTRSFRATYSDYRNINEFKIRSYIYDNANNINRAFHIGDGEREFPFSGRVTIENGIWDNLAEGGEYVDSNGVGGVLVADKLRWSLINSEGSPQIKNVVASQTAVLFTKPGFAEVAFDVELTWKQDGQTLKSSFKPNTSGLYAFYPATGNVEFNTFHPAQLSTTQRLLEIRNFSVEINGQKRLVESESDWKFAQPLILCRSIIDPASYPLQVVNAWPAILSTPTSGYPNGRPLTQNGVFKYLTLSANAGIMPLRFFCEFQPYSGYVTYSRLSFVKDLPSITVYTSADVMEAVLHPVEVNSIQEGQQVKFNAEVRPRPGFGEGSISTATKDLNILDGYKFDSIRYIRWLDRALFPTDNQAAMVENMDLTHDFRPKSGLGKYSLDCGVNFNLKDFETNKIWGRGVAANHPIELTPGLRILSPIDKLAYPLNRTIKVTTTMDAEEHAEQWEHIKWKLNGEDFFPPDKKPAFPLLLNKTGKWKIEAQLKTIDPNTGKEVTLYDSAEFEVKPLEVTITPTRRVLDFNKQRSAELKVSVLVNGNEIEKPGVATPWQTTGTQIIVDSVAWQLVAVTDNSAKLDLIPQSFKADCKFTSIGAATALATITVRIVGAKELFDKKHKGFNDKFEEQIFEIPADRADLWAIEAPVWLSTNGKTATRAIQETTRLFSIVSGKIKFDGKEYDWKNDSVFADKIKIPAAIPNVSPLTSVDVKIRWEGPEDQSSEESEFKPKFAKLDKQQIIMNSAIEFGSNGRIEFSGIKTDVYVKPLAKVIYTKATANPSAVAVNKPAQICFRFGEMNPVTESQTQLKVWNGEYDIALDSVEWSSSGGVVSSNEPNIEFSCSNAGQYIITGKPHFTVKPQDCNPVEMTLDPSEASVKVLGSLIGIRVDNTLPDHLKRIRYAADPGNDIYDKSNNHIWSRTDTRPLVIACNSTVTLIPEFEGQKKYKIRDGVSFQWFDSDGLLALSGNTDLADKIEFPTPTVIDKYALKLDFVAVGETIEIPDTYTVKKITKTYGNASGTTDIVYYMKCIDDSVVALKGKNSSTSDAIMVNDFYAWWWNLWPNPHSNELHYGVIARTIYDVINKKGGMCQALGNYFFKCLQCQSVEGVERIGFHLHRIEMTPEGTGTSILTPINHTPKNHEYWGAIFIKNVGLNNEQATYYIPNLSTATIYLTAPLRVYTGEQAVPPADYLDATIVDLDTNVEEYGETDGYVFRATDGHAFVIFKDKVSGKINLLDPSFISLTRTMIELPDIPNGTVMLKEIDQVPNPKYKEFREYLSSFTYFRGYTAYKSSVIESGMGIFDFKIDQMNYLRASFSPYSSVEE